MDLELSIDGNEPTEIRKCLHVAHDGIKGIHGITFVVKFWHLNLSL